MLSDVRPGNEPAVDRYHRLDRECTGRPLDCAFLVHESAMRAVCSSDRRPQRLLAMQPARIPATRLVPGDAVPEALDRTGKLERLGAQRRSGGWCVQLQSKKTRLQVGQVDVAACASRAGRCVYRPPTSTTRRCPHAEAARGCAVSPIDDEPSEPAPLGEVHADPGPRIVGARDPARSTERLIGAEARQRARGARPRVRQRNVILDREVGDP